MDRLLLISWSVILLLNPLCLVGQVEQLSFDDLQLSTEKDFLDIEVTTASKSLEGLTDAPGVITVVTAEEIERFGANNVLEIIERVASIYPIGSFYLPQNYVSIRGDLSAEYNHHVLILINGRPSRENLLGGIDYPLFFSIPVQMIERVEVVRGPGSVLYGSNAYSGFINIITREVEEDLTEVRSSYGTFDTFTFGFSNATVRDELRINTGLTYFNQAGWRFENIGEDIPLPPPNPPGGFVPGDTLVQNMSQNNAGGLVSVEYKDFSLTALLAYSGHAHHGAVPFGTYPGPFGFARNRAIESLRTFADAGYNFDVSNSTCITFNTTYNSLFARFKTPVGDAVIDTRDVILEPTAFLELSEKVDWLIGATTYFQRGSAETGEELDRGVAHYSETWFNAYTQFRYEASNTLAFVVGGQLNKPSGLSVDFVPRLGAIITPSSKIGGKILYGQAYRAPFEAEQSLFDVPIILGNPDLDPEKVSTLDIQWFYNSARLYLAATYFRSVQKDLITRSPVLADTGHPDFPGEILISSFSNKNRLVLRGVEIEGKWAPARKALISGSFTYQPNVLNDTVNQATLAPKYMAKLGAHYTWKNGISLGVFDTWFSSAGIPVGSQEKNPSAEAFHSLTARLDIDVLRLFKRERDDLQVSMNLYGTNLVGNTIRFPEYVRRNINTIPGRGGRAIYAGMELKF